MLVCVYLNVCGVGDSGNVDVWLFPWSGLGCLGGGGEISGLGEMGGANWGWGGGGFHSGKNLHVRAEKGWMGVENGPIIIFNVGSVSFFLAIDRFFLENKWHFFFFLIKKPHLR